MADRVFPSKPPAATATNGTAAATTTGANPAFPATKAQQFTATRPAYRPTPYHNRRRRSFCCRCCLWTTLLLVILITLAAIFGAIVYVIYRPHRPSFSVSSLHLSQFNLSSSSHLTAKYNLTIKARNPNKKITFFYNPIQVKISSNGVNVGAGTIPAFNQGKKNTTTLKSTVSATSQSVDADSLNLKSKKSVLLKIQMDTKLRVKIFGTKTKKIRIRVKCDAIRANLPTGKTATVANTANMKCKVDLRFKIWKITI
ncbi:hypothetical protein DCAR_0208612 [Daucus carota subsp. sativus]|uniref:Late embryogenesis abundant protein LEA-2 subgroup domain-containing protein n=1 Tax=Daucus carota subsp. sativus TaxID=79200 RepID=A0A166ENH6_DAUCS|nr:PREDICTED: protein YLS9 [Daucus carota subsp. sativus]WOG89374.1 hypothetical protein DCAR_0208612 [Daucus carota subsp. sativus]